MEDKLLIVHLSIGDEDGPSFSCLLANYNDYKDIIPKSKAIVVNLNDIHFNIDKATYINSDSNSFRNLFNEFKIADIVEIHDWYDYLTEKEVAIQQQYIDNVYNNNNNNIIPEYSSFVIVVPYNQGPIKYLIPHNSDIYKYISSRLDIFKKDDEHEEKQNLADIMRPYIVHASYYQIMKNGKNIIDHTVVISDDGNPINFQ